MSEWSCHDIEKWAARQVFEAQAPRRRVRGCNSPVEPLRENSVRTSAITIIEKPEVIFKYEDVTTHDAVHATWLETGKIATNRPIGPFYFRFREAHSILLGYQFGLSLGNTGLASKFRDALVDAMVEAMDDYGGSGDWSVVANAFLKGEVRPMWRLDCFYRALSTELFHYQLNGPQSAEVRECSGGDRELNGCWKDGL